MITKRSKNILTHGWLHVAKSHFTLGHWPYLIVSVFKDIGSISIRNTQVCNVSIRRAQNIEVNV